VLRKGGRAQVLLLGGKVTVEVVRDVEFVRRNVLAEQHVLLGFVDLALHFLHGLAVEGRTNALAIGVRAEANLTNVTLVLLAPVDRPRAFPGSALLLRLASWSWHHSPLLSSSRLPWWTQLRPVRRRYAARACLEILGQ